MRVEIQTHKNDPFIQISFTKIMLQPLGFGQLLIDTSLGKMRYYIANQEPWLDRGASDDREPLLFLHGFGGGSSSYEWSKVYPAFAAKYRVIAPDLIGWGKSAHPPRKYQIEDYLTTIREFIQQTCPTKVTVIASSLTAAFVIRIAINYPDLFKSLILVSPSGLADFGETLAQNFLTQLINFPIIDNLIYNIGIASELGIRSFLEQRQFQKANRIYGEIVEAYLQSALQPNGEYAALSFVGGDLWFDLSLYIQQLTIPTAIIWGEKSQFTGPEIGRRLLELNPQAVQIFQQIPDVGLTPQLELPAVTIGLIQKYLTALTL